MNFLTSIVKESGVTDIIRDYKEQYEIHMLKQKLLKRTEVLLCASFYPLPFNLKRNTAK